MFNIIKRSVKCLGKNKKIKNMFFIIFSILLALLLLLVAIVNAYAPKDNIEDLGSVEIEFSEYSVEIENFDEIMKKIPVASIDMRGRVQVLSMDYLKKLNLSLQKIQDDKINDYYVENKEKIDSIFLNYKDEQFKVLKNKLHGYENLSLTKMVFDEKTFSESDSEYIFNLILQYNDSIDLTVVVRVQKTESISEDNIYFELI